MTERRIERLLSRTRADAVLITSPQNRFYFSGFTGTAGSLVLTRNGRRLFTDSRYTIQAREQAKGFEIRSDTDKLYDMLKEADLVGIEEAYVTVSDFHALSEKCGAKTCDVSAEIARLRRVKDEGELACIREAARIADHAFSELLPQIKAGKTERELALALEFSMMRAGAEERSFDTIFASGPRGAMPHGTATDRPLQTGELVTMDFGCKYRGYCSDMTRTVAIGEPGPERREIYRIVREAQRCALGGMKPGASCRETDALARDYIREAGHGAHFGHSLGHSLGLDIHESPVCSPRSEDVLEAGMTMTAEPGVYIDGFCGVRIEDLVVITSDGYENLTHSDKELIVL